MRIYYENSINEKYDMSDFPVAIEDITSLFDKEWGYDVTEKKEKNMSNIDRVYRTSKKIKTKISVYADSEEEYKRLMNSFEKITEVDVLTGKTGKLWVDEYYLECIIVAASPKDYDEIFYTIDNDITIFSGHPFWIKETGYSYNTNSVKSTNNKKYPYRYPYRYANGFTKGAIINTHFAESNFLMIIYGPAANPQVNIGGIRYCVNIVLEAGERLEIDTGQETVTKIMMYGERVNAFHNREKKKTFFSGIQPGRQEVTWSGTFPFDLILYEERSTPKW